ncbi:MAG: TonB-dependent receptor [Chloracidobacterium sp.]|nr:TonB-dependent receptor [Chloracidobacterium sp.]
MQLQKIQFRNSARRPALHGLQKWIYILILGLVCTIANSARAQTAGRITGQTLDSSQAVIAGAAVTARNIANGQQRRATTDSQGRYVIADIPVGVYKVVAEHAGFQTQARNDVQINVAATVSIDFVLQTGQVSETVEVRGEGSTLETTQTSGGVMNNKSLVELPINGRDYARFSLLIPGAVARSNFIADLSFNGLHTVHNQFQIDGIDASRVDQPYMANGFERGARLLTGSLDTIAEFRVQTSNYNAEYGRASGSYINVATKSGGNQVHFTLFEFLRNSALDARNFFASIGQKPPFRFNDFGGNVGGPIIKDKTFYFVNYEGSRQRVGITGSGTVPSDELLNQAMAKSPVLKAILDMYPRGTSSTSNPLVDNFTTAQTSRVREDTGSVKIDHNFSDHDSAYVRVNVNDTHVFGPLFGVTPSALGLLDFQNVPVRTSNVAIRYQHIFSPRLVNEFLTGFQRWGSQLISDSPFPLVSVTGLTAAVGTRGRSVSNNTVIQWSDTTSYTHGAHTLKWGGDVHRFRINRLSTDTSSITYTSIADFINNSAASANYTVGNPGSGTRATQLGLFIQDTWKARQGLTIDYGLRYDVATVPYDPQERAQTFDTRSGDLAAPGAPYFRANTRNFAPRFGVAWQPGSKTVVRSGYGVFWQAYPVGFGSYSVPVNNIPGNTTLNRIQIPSLAYPLTPFLSQGAHPAPTVAGFDWIKRDIYVQQWNLTVARELTKNDAIQISYIGNHGLNLRRNLNINFVDPVTKLRPNTKFSDINIETATGQNIYHALQISFKRRLSAGLQYDVNYTWARAIDDVQDQGLYSAQPQDNNNLRAERGSSSGDIRHTVNFNALYELPIGQGHRLFGNAKGVGGFLAGGWKLSALGILRTGIADTVFIGANTFGNGNFTNQRPNAAAGVSPYAENQSPDNWLNPAAFSMPAPGTFGNLGRNTIFGPSFKQIDFSLLKDMRISERFKLEYRAEFFNIFNHPNFDQPNTTFGTSNFGKIFNTFGRTLGVGTSRQIQMAFRLTF